MKLSLFGFIVFSVLLLNSLCAQEEDNLINPLTWVADNGDSTFKNPVIYADYSDPDVIRVEDDFYLVSSSFSQFPGLPVLHSKDLINWKIIGHAAEQYPFEEFRKPQHGKGLWAPSIRYHKDKYWIFVGDPDHGILMTQADDPAGPWSPIHVVEEGKGLIDPCPFWDDDGKAYLVHAWAKSRAGFNSILTLKQMSPDGRSILDSGRTVFDGHENQPTIEGPKMYKRNGYYYIFAPAGGVKPGWQTILRSDDIYGPYEDKIVLEQGSTNINGPHQGGLVELKSGDSWFVHFQDRYAYGRVVHVNPVNWIDDWPEMGLDIDGNGVGEPGLKWNKPEIESESRIGVPQTNDNFTSSKLGLQWQWEALTTEGRYSLTDSPGNLRLYPAVLEEGENLRDVAGIIGQKFPADEFKITVKLSSNSGRSGLVVLGTDYATIEIVTSDDQIELRQVVCRNADSGGTEKIVDAVNFNSTDLYLRVTVREEAKCNFSYSLDGESFEPIGSISNAKAGRWVGARIGLFSVGVLQDSERSYTDFDWVRFTSIQ